MEFIKRFHLAGFTLHVHVIGDGTLTTVLDALEASRAADGISTQLDGLRMSNWRSHRMLRASARIIFVAFTYSWANADPDYDMTVVPFVDKVIGNGYAALHTPGAYYESNVYPFKAVKEAGGILVAGSDAPVNTRDPQPFVNMAIGVTRRLPGQRVQNVSASGEHSRSHRCLHDQCARFLHRDQVAGSLEVGKSGDFIVVDQDILQLASAGHADDIARTHVLGTWFQGKKVYTRDAKSDSGLLHRTSLADQEYR